MPRYASIAHRAVLTTNLAHLQLYHEEVQYNADGSAVQCTKCLKEVRTFGEHFGRTCAHCSLACMQRDLLPPAAVAAATAQQPLGWPLVHLGNLHMLRPLRLPLHSPLQVVGAHYENEEPGFPTVVLCMNCCWEEQIVQASGGEDSSSAMQLRMPAPGQRLLPPLAAGGGQDGGSGRWSWLGGAATSGGAGVVISGGTTSSGEGSSEESEDGGAAGGRRQRRRTSGATQARLQQLRLQQQMEEQVYSAGGLLAAVARRLDSLAQEALRGGGSGRRPFEETLLELVGQAQRLLR